MAGNILNFSTSRLITGINVIDGMLFWVDNETEPHKINIEKFKGNFEGVDVDHTSGTTQIYNRPFELRDITVLKEHPTESLQTDFTTVPMSDPIDTFIDTDPKDDGGGGSGNTVKSVSRKKLKVETFPTRFASVVETRLTGMVSNTKKLIEAGFYWSNTNSTHKTILAGLNTSPPTSFKVITDTNVITQDINVSVHLDTIIQSVDSTASNQSYNTSLSTGALSWFAFGKEDGFPQEDYGQVQNTQVKAQPSAQGSGVTTDFVATGSYSPYLTGAITLTGTYKTDVTVSSQGFYVSKPYVNSDYGSPTLAEIIEQADKNTDPSKQFPGKYEVRDNFGNSSGSPLPSFSTTLRDVQGGYTYFFVGYLIDRNGTQYSDGHVAAATVKTKVITAGAKNKPGVYNLKGVSLSGGAVLKAEIYNTGFTGANISDYGFYFSTTLSDPYDLADEFSQGVASNGAPTKTGAAANTFKLSCASTHPLQSTGVGNFDLDTTIAMQNLAAGTTIYYVAYATNSAGEALATNYGSYQYSMQNKAAEIAEVQTAKDLDKPIIQISDIAVKSLETRSFKTASGNVDLTKLDTATQITSPTMAYDVKIHFSHSPASLGTPDRIILHQCRPSGNDVDVNHYNGFDHVDDVIKAIEEYGDPTGEGDLLDLTGVNPSGLALYPTANTRLFETGGSHTFELSSPLSPALFSFDPDKSTNTTASQSNFIGEYKTDFRLAVRSASIEDLIGGPNTGWDYLYRYHGNSGTNYKSAAYKAHTFVAQVEYSSGKSFFSELQYAGPPTSFTVGTNNTGTCGLVSGAPTVKTQDSTGDAFLKSSVTQNSVKLLGMIGANGGPGVNQQVVQTCGFKYSTTKPPTTNVSFFGTGANDDLDTWASSASSALLSSSTSPTTLAQARTHAVSDDPDTSDVNVNGCYRQYAVDVTGLTPNTTYYFVAFCSPSQVTPRGGYASILNLARDDYNATKYGHVKEFTTEGTGSIVDHPPTVTILDFAVDSKLSKVFLTGEAIAEGKNYKVNSVGFYLKPTSSFSSSATEAQRLTELGNATSRITITGTPGVKAGDDLFESSSVISRVDYHACAFATFKINGGNITNPVLSSNTIKILNNASVAPQSALPNVASIRFIKGGKGGTLVGEASLNTSGITAAGFYVIGKQGQHAAKAATIGAYNVTTDFPSPSDGTALKTIFDSPPSGVVTHNLSVASGFITDPFRSFSVPFTGFKFDHTYYAAAYATNSDGTALAPSCLHIYQRPPVAGSIFLAGMPQVYDKNGNFRDTTGKSTGFGDNMIVVSTQPDPGEFFIAQRPTAWSPSGGDGRLPILTITKLFGIPFQIHVNMIGAVNKGAARRCEYVIKHRKTGEEVTLEIKQDGASSMIPKSPLYTPQDPPKRDTNYNP